MVSRLLGAEGEAVQSASRIGTGSCDQAGAGPGKFVSPRRGAGKLGSSSRLKDRVGFR